MFHRHSVVDPGADAAAASDRAGIGVDPIHFGIIVVTNLSIGTFTPPFGINIFVAQSIFDVPLRSIYAGLVPFIAVAIVGLMIVTYVPELSLWLVRFIG